MARKKKAKHVVVVMDSGQLPQGEERDLVTFQDVQHLVGGYVAAPYVPGLNEAGIQLWCDEDGEPKGLPLTLNVQFRSFSLPLLGTLVFTDSKVKGLTEDQLAFTLLFLKVHMEGLR